MVADAQRKDNCRSFDYAVRKERERLRQDDKAWHVCRLHGWRAAAATRCATDRCVARPRLRDCRRNQRNLVAPAGIDWICVSPKAGAELKQRSGDELKLVFRRWAPSRRSLSRSAFRHFFLQPMDGPDRERNTQARAAILPRPSPLADEFADAQAAGNSLKAGNEGTSERVEHGPIEKAGVEQRFQFDATFFPHPGLLPSRSSASASQPRLELLLPECLTDTA